MAYTIPTCDTHRIPYPNAVVTAYRLGSQMQTTDQIKFKHGKEGVDLGFEVKTNARGYFCDDTGTLYSNGVFVSEDAIIKVTLPDGASTTWEVVSENDVEVNDGLLYGTKNKDTEELEVKWSANSANSYTLDYDHLIHKPRVNEWMETDQFAVMDGNGHDKGNCTDSLDVDKYCKTLTISFDGTLHPQGWSFVDGEWKCSKSAEQNVKWSLKLFGDTTRVAQVIVVRNYTPWRLAIFNDAEQLVTVLDAYVGVDNAKTIALFGSQNVFLPFHEVDSPQMVMSQHFCVLNNTTVPYNSYSNPIVIDDYTPDMFRVHVDSTYGGSAKELVIKSEVTKSRKIHLWLTNALENCGMEITDVTNNPYSTVCVQASGSIVELLVSPNGITLLGAPLKIVGPTLTLDGSGNQNLPPESQVIVGSCSSLYEVNCNFDTHTDKMIYGYITSTSAAPFIFRLDIGGALVDLTMLPNTLNKFVVHKLGNDYCVLQAPSAGGSGKYLKITPTGHTPHNYFFKLTRTSATQNTVHINIPYLMTLQGVSPDTFGSQNSTDDLIFDVSDLIGVSQHATLHFEIDAYAKSENNDHDKGFIGFGDSNLITDGLIQITEGDYYTFSVSRKNLSAAVYRFPAAYVASNITYEDTV
jgi:hypothetical protein